MHAPTSIARNPPQVSSGVATNGRADGERSSGMNGRGTHAGKGVGKHERVKREMGWRANPTARARIDGANQQPPDQLPLAMLRSYTGSSIPRPFAMAPDTRPNVTILVHQLLPFGHLLAGAGKTIITYIQSNSTPQINSWKEETQQQ